MVLALVGYVGVEALGGRRALDLPLQSSGLDVRAALNSLGASMSTSVPGMEIKEYCTSTHSKALAARFQELTRAIPGYTSCPTSTWLDVYHGEPALAGAGTASSPRPRRDPGRTGRGVGSYRIGMGAGSGASLSSLRDVG